MITVDPLGRKMRPRCGKPVRADYWMSECGKPAGHVNQCMSEEAYRRYLARRRELNAKWFAARRDQINAERRRQYAMTVRLIDALARVQLKIRGPVTSQRDGVMPTFVPTDSYPASECQMLLAAVVNRDRADHGPAIADVDVACIHEHIVTNVPACPACLDRHVRDPLCCRECEMGMHAIVQRRNHCCAVTLTIRARDGVTIGGLR